MINIMYYFIYNIITQLSVEKINNSFFKLKNSYILLWIDLLKNMTNY